MIMLMSDIKIRNYLVLRVAVIMKGRILNSRLEQHCEEIEKR